MRRVAAVVAVTVASLVVFASPAAAAGCAEAPVPSLPTRGITGTLLDAPDNPPTRAGGSVTFFEVYGPQGQYVTDQSGCLQAAADALTGGAASAGQEAASGQTFANWIMLGPEWGTAALASLADAAYDTTGWLTVLDPIWTTISSALRNAVTRPFAPVVAVIVLIVLGLALGRGRVAAFAGTLAVTLAATALIVANPATLARTADGVIVGASTSIRDGINGTTTSSPGAAMVGGLSDRIVFDSWCAGMVGDAKSITASKYCPRLYDASHFTWVEAARADQDPAALKDITDAKQEAWKAAAADLKDEDPDAYRNLTGENGAARVGQALNAAITWAVSLPMLFVALILVVAAFFVIRLVVVFLPILGLLMVVPRFHHLLPSVGATLGAAVINSVVFSAVASVTALVCTSVMNAAAIPWPIRLLLCLAFTVVVWVATKPFRKLTRMVSNWDPTREMGKLGDKIAGSVRDVFKGAVGSAVGSAAGIKVSGVADSSSPTDEVSEVREPRPYRRRHTRPDVPPVEPLALDAAPASPAAGHAHSAVDPAAAVTALPGKDRDSDVAVVNRPQPSTTARPVNDYPGAINVDGVTVHDKRDPTARGIPEHQPGSDSGTYIVFDPDLGLVEVNDGADQ